MLDAGQVRTILDEIIEVQGQVSIHRIVEGDHEQGSYFLVSSGLRFMFSRQDAVVDSFGDGMRPVTSDTMRLVSINVVGMTYADGTLIFKGRSSTDRLDPRYPRRDARCIT